MPLEQLSFRESVEILKISLKPRSYKGKAALLGTNLVTYQQATVEGQGKWPIFIFLVVYRYSFLIFENRMPIMKCLLENQSIPEIALYSLYKGLKQQTMKKMALLCVKSFSSFHIPYEFYFSSGS